MTALVEHFDGRFEILGYKEFCKRLKAKEKANGSSNSGDKGKSDKVVAFE